MRIKIWGPCEGVTGYAEMTRRIALALDQAGTEVLIKAQDWACTKVELSMFERNRLDLLKSRGKKPAEIHLFINVPSFYRPHLAPLNLAFSMQEVDGLPGTWVNTCNEMDRVLVPSSFNEATFHASGVRKEKVKVVPLGVDTDMYSPQGPRFPLPLDSSNRFVFLSVGEWGYRKGFDLLLKAYFHTFSPADPVCLVLKSHRNGSDYDPTGSRIQKEVARIAATEKKSTIPTVLVLSQTINREGMAALYRRADCFVLPSRGEGWCMPVFEALSCQAPVIVTEWSAYMDYLNKDNAYPISVERLEPVPVLNDPVDECYGGFCWASPSLSHLEYLMRHVYENRKEAEQKAERGRQYLETHLQWSSCAKKIMDICKDSGVTG